MVSAFVFSDFNVSEYCIQFAQNTEYFRPQSVQKVLKRACLFVFEKTALRKLKISLYQSTKFS